MPTYQVICITKANAAATHENITHIGYYEPALRSRVIISVAEAISRIDANSKEFYISVPQATAYISVVKPEAGKPYIKTMPDSTGADNLLKLNPC